MTKPQVHIDFSNLPHNSNPKFYPLYFARDRYLVLNGGAGSGKSDFCASNVIKRTVCEKKSRFLIVRKVKETIRSSVWQLLIDVIERWGLAPVFEYTKNEFRTRCQNGNEIICIGLDDVEKVKSIQGITSIWIEEATELSMAEFDQLDLRLRGDVKGNEYKQIMLSFNPVSSSHWIKKRFFDQPNENARISTSTYLDNKFIGPEYHKVLMDMAAKNPAMYRIYGLGEWGVMVGLIYERIISIPEFPPLEWFDQIIYGLDFGFNHPSALVQACIKGQSIYFREMLYQTGLTNTQLIERCKPLIVTKRTQAVSIVPVYADCAEPDRIQEFKDAGINCLPCYKAKTSIRDGINFIKKYNIYTLPTNVNMNKEFGAYSWELDKNGEPTDEPIDAFNHAMDAGRYAVATGLNKHKSGKAVFFGGMDAS